MKQILSSNSISQKKQGLYNNILYQRGPSKFMLIIWFIVIIILIVILLIFGIFLYDKYFKKNNEGFMSENNKIPMPIEPFRNNEYNNSTNSTVDSLKTYDNNIPPSLPDAKLYEAVEVANLYNVQPQTFTQSAATSSLITPLQIQNSVNNGSNGGNGDNGGNGGNGDDNCGSTLDPSDNYTYSEHMKKAIKLYRHNRMHKAFGKSPYKWYSDYDIAKRLINNANLYIDYNPHIVEHGKVSLDYLALLVEYKLQAFKEANLSTYSPPCDSTIMRMSNGLAAY